MRGQWTSKWVLVRRLIDPRSSADLKFRTNILSRNHGRRAALLFLAPGEESQVWYVCD